MTSTRDLEQVGVRTLTFCILAASTAVATLQSPAAAAASDPDDQRSAEHRRVVEHWTAARRRAAIPRDLVIDSRGQGYLRTKGGVLQPYGRQAAGSAGEMTPRAKPGGGDTTPPSVTNLIPGDDATVGASQTFQATVTDTSGLRSVRFTIQKQGSTAQSFTPSLGADNVYSIALTGLTNGSWSWFVVAKDKANNSTTSPTVVFSVGTGGGGGDDTVENAEWATGGAVQAAVGRIYFEMPSNARRTRWAGYVCSGTVVNDSGGVSGRSVILTASHCVYDDANKAFARNVLFIPNQSGTTGAGTDLNCANDPIGCWTPSFGVVDINWTTRTFPNNVAWDYAFYVVNDSGSHTPGRTTAPDSLDGAVTELSVSFATPAVNDGVTGSDSGDFTHALGYSYSEDPNFMYCAEDMTTEGTVNWWLPNCGLSGGSSGGPWVQPMNTSTGSGSIISVNSWGYTNEPGMAGPKLSGTSASCVFSEAKTAPGPGQVPAGDEGLAVTCP
jgi:hypothetical protein